MKSKKPNNIIIRAMLAMFIIGMSLNFMLSCANKKQNATDADKHSSILVEYSALEDSVEKEYKKVVETYIAEVIIEMDPNVVAFMDSYGIELDIAPYEIPQHHMDQLADAANDSETGQGAGRADQGRNSAGSKPDKSHGA